MEIFLALRDEKWTKLWKLTLKQQSTDVLQILCSKQNRIFLENLKIPILLYRHLGFQISKKWVCKNRKTNLRKTN